MRTSSIQMMSFVAALFAVGVLFGAAPADGWNNGHEFSDSFEADLKGIETISISITNGSIDVSTRKGGDLEIEIEERVRKDDKEDAKEIADQVRLVSERKGSILVVEVDWGGISKKDRDKYSSQLDVNLPEEMSLVLETTNGSIQAERVEGEMDVETINGSVKLSGCGGDAKVHTTNGSVKVGIVGGELRASTTNGNIRLSGAGGDIKGHTTNGSITLYVDEDSSFEVEAETTNGKIVESLSSKHFRGEFNKKHTRLRGEYRDADYRISLKTTNGSVIIEES